MKTGSLLGMSKKYPPVILTDDELNSLLPIIHRLARAVGKNFPKYRVDEEDLVQQAFLGILRTHPRMDETEDDLLHRRIASAENRMIDAFRAYSSRRNPGLRRMEVLVEDITKLRSTGNHINETLFDTLPGPEEIAIQKNEVRYRTSHLKPIERHVIKRRLEGIPFIDIGKELGLGEARVCQLQIRILKYLELLR